VRPVAAIAASATLLLASLAGAAEGPGPGALPGAPPLSDALRARLAETLAAEGERPRYTNRLLLSASPYLRQHAHNPVDWRPWGEAAFAAAREAGRPLFVSVGYATCRGCRVMEEESYDDPEVAELLNAGFVAVKVDRTTRPDVAETLARYVAAMGVRPGWPLHVFLTPEGHPYHGATFLPRRDRPGRPGIQTVLASAERAFRSEPESLARRGARLRERVRAELAAAEAPEREGAASEAPGAAALHRAAQALLADVDLEWGGTRARPKHPLRPSVPLLLRYHRRTGDERALEAALASLERMAAGAVRDPVGGGFHRAAEDRRWREPHFEKTLAVNARVALAYLEAWQVTGRPDLAAVARETLAFVLRELAAPGGGFFAALDAESRDAAGGLGPGAYYTWTRAQVREALPAELARAAIAAFGVGDEPSAPHRARPLAALAAELDLSEEEARARVEEARAVLLRARASRPRPAVDDQVLTAWNGLAISALARAGFALEEPAFVEAARRAAEFVLTHGLPDGDGDGRLVRAWSDGRREGPALLEDHALLAAGLLDLAEADPDPRWLREALARQAVLDRNHVHPDGGYTRRARDAEARLPETRPVQDGAVPAGNAVAAWNLVRLHALTGDDAYRERARALFRGLRGALAADPAAASELLVALDAHEESLHEVVVVHPAGADPAPLLAPLRRGFVPNRVLLVAADGAGVERLAALASLAAHRRAQGGRTTAYVCRDHVCASPTHDPQELAEQLAVTRPLE